MTADLVLVEGNPLEDITLLASPPVTGPAVHLDAIPHEPSASQYHPALQERYDAACSAARTQGSAIRMVLRQGLLAVVPSMDMLDINLALYP